MFKSSLARKVTILPYSDKREHSPVKIFLPLIIFQLSKR